MKLRTSLLLSYTVAALIPISGVAYLAYNNAKSELMSMTSQNMETILDSRQTMIRDYFTGIQTHVDTLSKSPAVKTAMDEFARSFSTAAAEYDRANR